MTDDRATDTESTDLLRNLIWEAAGIIERQQQKMDISLDRNDEIAESVQWKQRAEKALGEISTFCDAIQKLQMEREDWQALSYVYLADRDTLTARVKVLEKALRFIGKGAELEHDETDMGITYREALKEKRA
jgi:hypothetical protein